MEEKSGCLVLENGMVFRGTRIGAVQNVIAEIVFATGMNGYLETLTDKSYYGQAVVQTFPLIGNYGVIPADFEAAHPALSAYIMNECCDAPSNFRCEGKLSDFLAEQNIPALCHVDTRTLTRVLRNHGTMNGMICDAPEEADLDAIRAYRVTQAVESTTCQSQTVLGNDDAPLTVALMDYGAKANIARSLVSRGCKVIILPAHTTAAEIAALRPDGIMLSNGAGDPQNNPALIAELQKIMQLRIPMMAICLGHQLLALANGIQTAKLKFGHRGANQPVLHLPTKTLAITTQNHGYQVQYDASDAHCRDVADLLYVNLNDNTCEGLRYRNIPAVSVQFHPEACAGPHDTEALFDEFVVRMKGGDDTCR